ncbi:MAG: hypothetical protein HY420_02985 [Candidatus Kerfeldbacteria bacterium]|nr:hypothetical protein [Candidatus Kerfeldbacteria bacterium]
MTKALKNSFIIIWLVAAIGIFRFSPSAFSKPLTSGASQKLTVYEGVITIDHTPGGNILELGNAGRDIASTGEIFVRPGNTTAGTKFYAASPSEPQNLLLTGRLTVNKGLNFNGQYITGWTTGSSFWLPAAGNYVEPNPLAYGVQFNSDTNVLANNGANQSALYVVNYDLSGLAAKFESPPPINQTINIYGNLEATGNIRSGAEGNLFDVWTDSNDGYKAAPTGPDYLDLLDADLLDGVNLDLAKGIDRNPPQNPACDINLEASSNMSCLCRANPNNPAVFECIELTCNRPGDCVSSS